MPVVEYYIRYNISSENDITKKMDKIRNKMAKIDIEIAKFVKNQKWS